MIRIRTAVAGDAAAVTAIYNQGIAERGATFETAPRRVEDIAAKLREPGRHPWLVATQGGAVLGWAGLSLYRPRDCYAGIAEFSVYLDAGARGRGLGKQLLAALVDEARSQGFHKLVSRIFVSNHASRGACRAAGFREVGLYEKHGLLDGEWRDVVVVERLIPENLLRAGTDATPPTTH